MTISEQIAELDNNIVNQFPKDCTVGRWQTKKHGICKVLFNQNDNSFLLHDSELEKVTIDDDFDVQLIHVEMNLNADTVEYGEQFASTFQQLMKLVVVTTKSTVRNRILAGFRETDNCQILRVANDTETIIKNELKIKVGPEKNYPPNYSAFIFYYNIHQLEPEIIDEL